MAEGADALHFFRREGIGEDDGFAQRVNAQALVVGNGGIGKFNRVAAIVAHAIEQLGELLIEALEKGAGSKGIGQRDTQIPPVHVHPVLQRQTVGHFETKASAVEHKPLVGVGADGLHPVAHGQQHVAGAAKRLAAVVAQRFDDPVVHRKRETPTGAELGNLQPVLAVQFDFLSRALLDERFVIFRHPHAAQLVPKLANQRHQRHFPQNGAVPGAFHHHRELAALLLDRHFAGVVTKARQKIEIGGV